ncbi:MAG TPA: tetratricopeptide repeat protein [Puia sp.]|nr:tetratricopeptide repeat protein [Puia sp.]
MATGWFRHALIIVPALLVSVYGNGQNSFQRLSISHLDRADSLFTARNWREAKKIYETTLRDTAYNSLEWNRLGFCDLNLGLYADALTCFRRSLVQQPSTPLKAIVYSRMARIYAREHHTREALENLDSAVASSYVNLRELDTLPDFASIRDDAHFKTIRQGVYATLYPCMSDPHAREFDFWVGEWDVYQTGTNNYQGHSLVQMISAGCAILENWDSQSSTGKSINFVDPVTNRWKQTWAGSYAGGIQEFVNGRYQDSAMRFDFQFLDSHGNKTIGRFVFYNQGPDQVRQFNETSADGGKTWTTSYDLTYRRKH